MKQNIKALLAKIGDNTPFTVIPLPGGRNNRAFKVISAQGAYFLKHYFNDPADARNRLEHEFGFLTYAWNNDIRCIPQPLNCSREDHLGLYSWVSGAPCVKGILTENDIIQAADFVIMLNRTERIFDKRLIAADACFSAADYRSAVEKRLTRLRQTNDHRLSELAELLKQKFDLLPLDEFKAAERILSPSDFGFHNALRRADGSAVFLDFEYAGWDDPAKLTCDFFCQPDVPVPDDALAYFVSRMVVFVSDRDLFRKRVTQLMPITRIKWCCIMLNEFLPESASRRAFAAAMTAPVDRDEQLERAADYYQLYFEA